MSFSRIALLPAELQLRVQYYWEGREWEICVSDVVPFLRYWFSLRAMACIQPFNAVLLRDSAVQYCAIQKATDSWQALTTFWTGLGSFYFQFKHFWICAWGNNLIKHYEGGVQTETKITPSRSEVLTMTFFKLWSMYVVFFLSSWVKREWREVLGFLRFLVHFICGVFNMYSLKVLWTKMQVWMNAIKRYCKQQGRQSCLTLLDMMIWRWQVAANTVAEAMLKMF